MDRAAIFDVAAMRQPAAPASGERARARRRAARQQRLRAGLLAVVLALSAVIAQGWLGALGGAFGVHGAAGPVRQPFETPGESFPGSAFYWLEDTPRLATDITVLRPPEGAYETVTFARTHDPAAAAAQAFRAGGSGLDKARALQCLSMAVYYEAASETLAGQQAVAQVVLNRVAHPAYPNSVCGVVFQGSERKTGCQFTFTCDGALARPPSRLGYARAQSVALAALAGFVYAPIGLATHYHTNYVNPYWAASLDYITTIGAHRFYRWKGAAGQREAFTSPYAGSEALRQPASSASDAAGGGAGADGRDAAAAPAPGLPAGAGVPLTAGGPSAAPPAAAPTPDTLPAAGTVRDAYRNSGRWIAEPGKPKKD